MPRSPLALLLCCAALAGCRIESATPRAAEGGGGNASDTPRGELWVYTSMYRQVLDALDPLVAKALPGVTVHWYQAGSEKVANRLEAELTAGGTQADLLITSDPFLYERFKREGRLLPYASPYALRIPRALVDPDAAYTACRLSTMVLVYRADLPGEPPSSFRELTQPRWKGQVALVDPLTSGTGFTWAVFLEQKYGAGFFAELRQNGARVAGGNAAAMQAVQGNEAQVGVVLLENALAAKAKGSALGIAYPSDGAVIVPGYAAIFRTSRNPGAARALEDLLLSPEGQAAIVRLGDMHAVDPRVPGPRGEVPLSELLARSQPWDESALERGLTRGAEIKASFSKAFSQ